MAHREDVKEFTAATPEQEGGPPERMGRASFVPRVL